MAAVTRRFGPHADRLVFHDSAEGRVRIRLDALSDAILGRKDGSASYHLACVVDDHAQGVTKVTRGRDLLSSTPVQRLLYELLALPPPVYAHHSLVCDRAGRRLAKRDGARSLMELRGRGVDPEQLCADLRRGRLAAYDAQLTG
jgi:glutamyl-Q tRNA(Asp) synthetase